ncbi:hypothetical protein CFOL_v3_24509 [Cephalotus follicularis]|uniref:Uncharacterized protein n=1 Tax=Cephalotus follicularis TaxID=3775 RepID=A0A1Q3CLC0_CEPFO|nr:hypothetical protein CFOL_v3_24509 [Cephalotus follicularis]
MSDFNIFRCFEKTSASVNLGLLFQSLNFGGAHDALYFDDCEHGIGLVFENPVTRRRTSADVTLIEVNEDCVDIDDINFEYNTVVGIPLNIFWCLMMQLVVVEEKGKIDFALAVSIL